jgi:hypothetical protein
VVNRKIPYILVLVFSFILLGVFQRRIRVVDLIFSLTML